MKTQRPGQVVLPRSTSGHAVEQAGEWDWHADPLVVTTSEASKQARRAWMKLAPPENWLLRDLDSVQLAALLRMLETDAAYRAAKAAAHACVR